MIGLGLMSGTSLDGIDAALVRLAPRGEGYAFELLAFTTESFSPPLDAMLRSIMPPQFTTSEAIALANRELGLAYARAARSVAGAASVAFAACHGQTVFHDGRRHVTLQLGDPFVLRETLSTTVCYDFRRADCAVGGHGAPLVPYVDALLLGSDAEDRVTVNIGGISNLTALPRGSSVHDVTGFDCGPGTMLLDALVRERTGGAASMDVDGDFARAGKPDATLVEAMIGDPYFEQPPPKSTGREHFGASFLERHAIALERLSLPDAAATLTLLTARAIAGSIGRVGLSGARVICSGGGARHPVLMRQIAELLPHARVETSDSFGVPADAKEAIAFAVLGYETLRERAANVPRVTGASRAVPLGAIAPHALRDLLKEVESECQSS